MSTDRPSLSWTLGKILATFLLGGMLIAYLLDAILLSAAAVLDILGHRSHVGGYAREIPGSLNLIFSLLIAPIVYLPSQLYSAVLASVSFVFIRRVPFWWVMAGVPLVAVRGFSFFGDLVWEPIRLPWRYFLMLCALQSIVSICCWWLARTLVSGRASPRIPYERVEAG
jgi:hypothetical protein